MTELNRRSDFSQSGFYQVDSFWGTRMTEQPLHRAAVAGVALMSQAAIIML